MKVIHKLLKYKQLQWFFISKNIQFNAGITKSYPGLKVGFYFGGEIGHQMYNFSGQFNIFSGRFNTKSVFSLKSRGQLATNDLHLVANSKF